jgi:predicted ATP-grasp superfamily ATP-dependent carboligase
MLLAVVEDFAAAGFHVFSTLMAGINPPNRTRCRWIAAGDELDPQWRVTDQATRTDWTLIIAPEFDNLLLNLCEAVILAGGRSLNAPLATIRLAADKHATAEHLAASGVRAPSGVLLSPGSPPSDFSYPAVLKPRYGAGSQGVRLVAAPAELEDSLYDVQNAPAQLPLRFQRSGHSGSGEKEHGQSQRHTEGTVRPEPRPCEASNAADPRKRGRTGACGCEPQWRLEEFCPGLAASVGFLCGPRGCVALPACRQHVARDRCGATAAATGHNSPESFEYLGGSLPLVDPLARRATRLARRAIELLPEPRGYIGVDLILGPDADGLRDYVIEINPRLTTSYAGLRALCHANLAQAMVTVARGEEIDLSFGAGPLQFSADGRLGCLAASFTRTEYRG